MKILSVLFGALLLFSCAASQERSGDVSSSPTPTAVPVLVDETSSPTPSTTPTAQAEVTPTPYPVIDLSDDNDGDLWTEAQGDCDDSNWWVAPGAREYCDYQDNDCDGIQDESGRVYWFRDVDNDGWGVFDEYNPDVIVTCGEPPEVSGYVIPCCDEDDGSPDVYPYEITEDFDFDGVVDGDCDDTNPAVYSGATDVPCDGIDQDCDGTDYTAHCPGG